MASSLSLLSLKSPPTFPDKDLILGLACMLAKSLQSCLTLCDCMGDNPPGSTVHGILHARILDWVAVPSFRGSSGPRDGTVVSGIYLLWRESSSPLVSLGKSLGFRAQQRSIFPIRSQSQLLRLKMWP